MKLTILLLLFAASTYADGVRQQSGPVGKSDGGSHSTSQGSRSRSQVVIDGQYSALPVANVDARWAVAPAAVEPGDVEDGGAIVGPPRPMEAATPEPGSFVLAFVLLVVVVRMGAR